LLPGAVFLRVMRPKREVDHSPSIRGEASTYTPPVIRLHGAPTDDFTFLFTWPQITSVVLLLMLTALLKYVDYFIACNISRYPD
jgi:hypothetical protein